MAGRISKSSPQQWAGAHALSGEAGGGACCGAVYDRVGDACGWWRARSAVLFPAALTLGVVVLVMLVVRVVWAPEWMIVSVAALLARVVSALE